MRKLTALATTLSATAVLTASLAGVALADPPSGTTPAAADIVGVGSDTVQGLFNAISSAANSANFDSNGAVAGTQSLYSYNAVDPSTGVAGLTITTKTGATPIARPNGSGQGITALTSNTSATVDFARSSRARKSTDPSTIKFVAYAGDAVTVASGTANGGTTNVPSNLDEGDLVAIYTCAATNFDQLPDHPGIDAPINAQLPQSGSGTRSFFETAINITDSQLGSCVGQTAEENEGNNSMLAGPDTVFPYSVAVALTQLQHPGLDAGSIGSFTFQDVDGAFPAAYDKSSKSYVINTAFPSNFERQIYNVVRQDTTTKDQIPAYLEGLFGAKGAICTYGASIISEYGFVPLSNYKVCGTVS